jgi:hypothetical protein
VSADLVKTLLGDILLGGKGLSEGLAQYLAKRLAKRLLWLLEEAGRQSGQKLEKKPWNMRESREHFSENCGTFFITLLIDRRLSG